MPACTALPFLPSSTPDTLRRPGVKWISLGLRVDEVLPAVGRSLCGQLSRPPHRRNYLLAFFGVQVVEPLLWVLRSGRQSPPAARRAPRLHAAAICGLSHSHPPHPESPSRGAGRTMELGAGPTGTARPRRRPSARLAVSGAEADRRTGGLTQWKVKALSLDLDPQIWFSPHPHPRPKASSARAVPSSLLA